MTWAADMTEAARRMVEGPFVLRPFSGAALLQERERRARLRRWQTVDRRPGRS